MAEPDLSTTQDQLDNAIRSHAQTLLSPGEVIVAWICLAATRRYDGGGVVVHMPSHGVMPSWEARGIIGEALLAVGVQHDDDEDPDQ